MANNCAASRKIYRGGKKETVSEGKDRKGQRANIQNRDEIDRVIALENVWRNKIGEKRRQ